MFPPARHLFLDPLTALSRHRSAIERQIISWAQIAVGDGDLTTLSLIGHAALDRDAVEAQSYSGPTLLVAYRLTAISGQSMHPQLPESELSMMMPQPSPRPRTR